MKIKKIKIKIRKNSINKKIRLAILAVIGLLLILSAYNAIGAYQKPTTITEYYMAPAVSYTHSGQYNFLAHLKYNTLYGENDTVLEPGEATIFKKLVNYISASFNYKFQADQTAQVEGTYKLEATVQTSIWSKTYVLVATQSFNGNQYTSVTIDFPFNVNQYEELVTTINEETGVVAQEPTLILRFMILTTAQTEFGEIRDAFSPAIQIPLSGNILEFQGDLFTKQAGAIETNNTLVIETDAAQQRTIWTLATILSSIFFVILATFTTSEIERRTPAEKILSKIQKKYGDWIVEADELPTTKDTRIISMKSFDDLLKISEEIGKPIIHVKTTTTNPGLVHTFYVFDEDIHYKHVLPIGEKIKKTVSCPKCNKKIECEDYEGVTIQVKCPSCENKGFVTLRKNKIKSPLKTLFSRNKKQ